MDHRDSVIPQYVSGKTFVEVGGIWGEVNEKTTIAAAGGAVSLCMVDIWKANSEWWEKFRARCRQRNVGPVREVVGSIDNPSSIAEIGTYDVVHCSGVLYHCPNPVLTISNLRAITGEILILAAATMPDRISNEHGEILFSDESAIFVPAISDKSRAIIGSYITQRYGGGAYGINAPVDTWFYSDESPNYGPWWWLWTPSYVASLLKTNGFEIIADYSQYDGTGHLFVCRKMPLKIENYGTY